jgi:hypothetical protein
MRYQIAIYAQHTTLAGRWAQDWDAETDAQSDDYVLYEGPHQQIIADADAADERAAQSGAGDDVYWRRVARSLREAVEWYNDTNIRVCELCGKEFHALACQDDEWVDADGDVVGYVIPIHEDDPLHEGAESGTACWRCAHEYMGHSIGECARCGDVFAWAQVEHGELLAANNGVVGRRTPDGPICADCDTEDES